MRVHLRVIGLVRSLLGRSVHFRIPTSRQGPRISQRGAGRLLERGTSSSSSKARGGAPRQPRGLLGALASYSALVTPPASPGKIRFLQTHDERVDNSRVADIDETCHLENGGCARSYTLTAAIVTAQGRSPPGMTSMKSSLRGGGTLPNSSARNKATRTRGYSCAATIRPTMPA